MIAIFDLLKAFQVEKTWSAVAISPAGPQVIFVIGQGGEERLRDPFPLLQSPLHYCSVCNEVVEAEILTGYLRKYFDLW